MAKKPPVKVKVRKWVTCAELTCKKRALTSGRYCGEHQEQFVDWEKRNVARRKKRTAARAEYLKRKEKEEKKKQKQTEKYSKAVDGARASVEAATKKRKADPKRIRCSKKGCKRRALDKSPFCVPHAKEHAARVVELVRKRSKKEKATAAARRSASPSSRLIKAHCQKCDYTIRLARKWIDVKRPLCPACLKNMVTELDGEADADPRQLKLKTVKKGGV